MSFYEILNLLLIFLTLAVLNGQLNALKKTYRADHERRKKQATIEYLNSFRTAYRHLEEKIISTHGNGQIPFDKMTDADKVDIRNTLSLVEHLAIGIETGIYDFELINRMSGAFLMGMYCKFKPYIETVRDSANNPNFYSEFEHLHKRIGAARKLASSGGALQHS